MPKKNKKPARKSSPKKKKSAPKKGASTKTAIAGKPFNIPDDEKKMARQMIKGRRKDLNKALEASKDDAQKKRLKQMLKDLDEEEKLYK